jgi:mRNA interferase MazF
MPKPGDIIIASVQFTDTDEVKTRPAVVLFEDAGNIVIAGITSNLKMRGIPLSRNEGLIKDSVIKLNYIFTISNEMVSRVVTHLSKEKKTLIFDELTKRLGGLKSTRADRIK